MNEKSSLREEKPPCVEKGYCPETRKELMCQCHSHPKPSLREEKCKCGVCGVTDQMLGNEPTHPMNELKRELLCQKCDREYPVWYTENELWDHLLEVSEENIHFLCPTCFAVIYEARIKRVTRWKLSIPEN